MTNNYQNIKNEKILVEESVDRNEETYYVDDLITFNIVITNLTNYELNDIMIEKLLPSMIYPEYGSNFRVEANVEKVTQKDNNLYIYIDKFLPHETKKFRIIGKIGR